MTHLTRASAALLTFLVLLSAACVDIDFPDDLGDEEDGSTTTSPEGDDTTDDEASDTDETGPEPDLPSDETTDESTSDETSDTDDTVDETGNVAETKCCTCPDIGTSEYECWSWDGMDAAQCLNEHSAAIGEATVWCETVDGYEAECLDQCN